MANFDLVEPWKKEKSKTWFDNNCYATDFCLSKSSSCKSSSVLLVSPLVAFMFIVFLLPTDHVNT